MTKNPRPASELKGLLSQDDIALLIEESCGLWSWFWQKPTLFHPRLWRFALLLTNVKRMTSGYLLELRHMVGSENYMRRVQETVLQAPRPITISMFFMLIVWAGEQCLCDSTNEFRRRCKQAARILYAVIRY